MKGRLNSIFKAPRNNFKKLCDYNVSNLIFIVSVVMEEPEFTDVIENVTVPAGRNVKLACSVKNLGTYRVSLL